MHGTGVVLATALNFIGGSSSREVLVILSAIAAFDDS
jgi:hypothetical protein